MSTRDSVSSIRLSLHQKWNRRIQFILTSWTDLYLSSKTLEFLSFHTVHHMHAGISLHHVFWLTESPVLFQDFSNSTVVAGIDHLSPTMLRNNCHSWVVIGQWRNKWLFISNSLPHKTHLEQSWNPFLYRFSWVKHDSLATSHVKQITL